VGGAKGGDVRAHVEGEGGRGGRFGAQVRGGEGGGRCEGTCGGEGGGGGAKLKNTFTEEKKNSLQGPTGKKVTSGGAKRR